MTTSFWKRIFSRHTLGHFLSSLSFACTFAGVLIVLSGLNKLETFTGTAVWLDSVGTGTKVLLFIAVFAVGTVLDYFSDSLINGKDSHKRPRAKESPE